MPDRQPLTRAEREATGWIVRIKAHDATEADRKEFQAWLDADPDHPKAYARLDRTWGAVQSLKHLKGSIAANDTAPPPNRRWALPAAIAGCALLAIGAGIWSTQAPSSLAPADHYVTAPAEVRVINLTDGSSITLSGAGEASVTLTDQERRVDLTSGSALFEVAYDPNRPFVVRTPQGDIKVLGTSFVVRVSEDEVRTTVLRGAVSATPGAGRFSPGNAVTVVANQEIVLREGRADLAAIDTETIPRRLAWRDNMLAFDGETLNEAIAQVSQQTGWEFELADPALGDARVSGYVRADPEAFIALLSSSLNLDVRREGERRVVLSRRS